MMFHSVPQQAGRTGVVQSTIAGLNSRSTCNPTIASVLSCLRLLVSMGRAHAAQTTTLPPEQRTRVNLQPLSCTRAHHPALPATTAAAC